MEPNQQMEIQLGHMCNNRCVFCVSGQRTEQREAFPLPGEPLIDELRRGYESGMRKITLLGGEPTLQPEFLRVLRAAVEFGFEEIVVFTNGVKTARASFVDELLAVGGNLTWRLSFQGADRDSHENTTHKPGSFGRLVSTLQNLRERGQRITVNMCVVTSNYESVSRFPKLLMPYGVDQLHLDMIRPLDAGQRTEDELRAMLPRYSELTPHLEQMIAGFPDGFDVNIGNLPYCIAPTLAPWIHHDGEHTLTIAIDEKDQLSTPWDKYEVKRRDKLKPGRCAECIFDSQCSGVFETYRDFYGLDELHPIPATDLPRIDPERRLFPLHVDAFLSRLDGWLPPAPFGQPAIRRHTRNREVTLSFPLPELPGPETVLVALRPPGGGFASNELFSLHCVYAPAMSGDMLKALFTSLSHRLCGDDALVWLHPLGDDAAFVPEAGVTGGIDAVLGRRLRQLREEAPFGTLSWVSTKVSSDGRRAELTFQAKAGEEACGVVVELGANPRGISGKYHLTGEGKGTPPAELAAAVRDIFDTLRRPLTPLIVASPAAPPPGPSETSPLRSPSPSAPPTSSFALPVLAATGGSQSGDSR